jgi:serine/threonine protein kinase
MKEASTYTVIDRSVEVAPVENPGQDYAVFLDGYKLTYRIEQSYILVGEPKVTQGWLMHLTVIPMEMEHLMGKIVPELIKFGFPFKIIRNKKLHKDLNAGFMGQFKLGKVVTIFLDEASLIDPFTERMIALTAAFTGPQIFTDFNIDNIIYTRYGSFVSIIQTDPYGNNIRVISDVKGNLFLDKYYTPPIIPEGIGNPFLRILQNRPVPTVKRWIGNKYLPVKHLKSDAKGEVWKALYFNKYGLPGWCVLKQGRQGMFPDEWGRDARNRLAWQFEVNKTFRNLIPTPAMLDHFNEGGQAYIAMKYVKGARDLHRFILRRLDGRVWFDQQPVIKGDILDYLLQIVRIIRLIHEQEYAHRDITSANFLLGRNKKIYSIDLELMYSLEDNLPDPPFGVGTPGYMSPEQELGGQLPALSDDSYSIGALMMMIFTSGISPHKLIADDHARLFDKLLFFVQDERLVGLMVKCIDKDPRQRPDIQAIYEVLSAYDATIKKVVPAASRYKSYSISEIRDTVRKGINTLSGDLLTHDNQWVSPVDNEFGEDVYPLKDRHFFGGIYKGAGGIIWFLGQAKALGFNVDGAIDKIQSGIDLIQAEMIAKMDSITTGLYYGRAGIAVTLASAIRNGFTRDDAESRDIIRQCFIQDTETLNLLYGTAGIGMALINTADYLDEGFIMAALAKNAQLMIDTQQKDGSWLSDHKSKDSEVLTGFGYGVAGITYFLLEHGFRYAQEASRDAAARGLAYLERKAQWNEDHYEWENSNKDQNIGHWWCKGGPGIALTFLKAFEVTSDRAHLEMAEKALRFHPRYLVNHKLSQCHGLSGLGEIYLETYRVSHKLEWLEKASWIADYLVNYLKEPAPGSVTWLTEAANFPTGDFMIGNSGILHFLLRFCFPEKLGFPFLPRLHNK